MLQFDEQTFLDGIGFVSLSLVGINLSKYIGLRLRLKNNNEQFHVTQVISKVADKLQKTRSV
jgi:hypothetical protein